MWGTLSPADTERRDSFVAAVEIRRNEGADITLATTEIQFRDAVVEVGGPGWGPTFVVSWIPLEDGGFFEAYESSAIQQAASKWRASESGRIAAYPPGSVAEPAGIWRWTSVGAIRTGGDERVRPPEMPAPSGTTQRAPAWVGPVLVVAALAVVFWWWR